MTTLFYVFLLVVAFAAVCVYLGFFFREVPGAAEERLGQLEPLPEDLGQWKTDAESAEAESAGREGLRREVRVLHVPSTSFFRSDQFVRQVRYRSTDSNDIVRIEPDVTMPRRRIR